MRGAQAVLSQQRADPQLGFGAGFDQALPVTHQPPEFARFSRGHPDFGDVAHAHQIGQQPRVAVIGLVRALFEPRDVAGMRQLDRPLLVRREPFRQIGCAAARLDRRSGDGALPTHQALDLRRVVRHQTIEFFFARLIEDAHLHLFVVIVQANKNWYTNHCSLLLKKGLG